MDGDSPGHFQGYLFEFSYYLRFDFSAFIIKRVLDIFPFSWSDCDGSSFLILHKYGSLRFYVQYFAELAVVILTAAVVSDEHDLSVFLQTENVVCRVAVFGEFAFDFCFDHYRLAFQGVKFSCVYTICLMVMGR